VGRGSDTTGPTSDATKDGYWALQLNHHAITLSLTAPSNQVQLQATPLTTRGDTIPTTVKVRYTSNDSSVIVDSTGLLTARLEQIGVKVIASLTIPNGYGQVLTLADTAVVNVNAVPAPIPTVTALQIMTPGDSATFSPVFGMTGLTVTAMDASNTPLTNVNVFCRSSDRNVVDFGQGVIGLQQGTLNSFQVNSYSYLPGVTTITCSATIYGVSRADSIPIRMGMPLYSKLTLDAVLVVSGKAPVVVSSTVVKIGVGGIIQWDNRSKQQVDLVFDDSTALQSVPLSEGVLGSGILGFPCGASAQAKRSCPLPSGAGNLLLPPNTSRGLTDGKGRDFRRFPVAGTYPYHSTTFPTITGTIIVTDTYN
jgi:hypothetical protein